MFEFIRKIRDRFLNKIQVPFIKKQAASLPDFVGVFVEGKDRMTRFLPLTNCRDGLKRNTVHFFIKGEKASLYLTWIKAIEKHLRINTSHLTLEIEKNVVYGKYEAEKVILDNSTGGSATNLMQLFFIFTEPLGFLETFNKFYDGENFKLALIATSEYCELKYKNSTFRGRTDAHDFRFPFFNHGPTVIKNNGNLIQQNPRFPAILISETHNTLILQSNVTINFEEKNIKDLIFSSYFRTMLRLHFREELFSFQRIDGRQVYVLKNDPDKLLQIPVSSVKVIKPAELITSGASIPTIIIKNVSEVKKLIINALSTLKETDEAKNFYTAIFNYTL